MVVIKKKLSNNNIINTFFEPVLNDNTPKWLVIKEKQSFEVPDGKNIKDIIKNPEDLETKKEIDVLPSGLWQCLKCGGQTQADKKPIHCPHCNRDTHFENITKIINQDLWKLPYWKDIPVEDLDMLNTYNDTIEIVKKLLVLPDDTLYKIFTLWIISTWKTGHWDAVAFPIFRGEYSTGKTTALDIIRELGYRMIHSAGTTFPAMIRGTHYYQAGLLIDEASDRLDRRTETGRELLNFVKPSYRRGSVYTVADKEDQEEMLCYKNFGFKAFAGERHFDPALLSRGIDFVMQEDYPEIPSIKYVQDELNNLQTKFLNYRYKTTAPPDLGMDFCLRGRLRETFESIIATGMHIGLNVDDIIEYAKSIKQEREEELLGTIEYDVILAINKLSQQDIQSTITGETDAPEHILYTDIFKEVFPDYEEFDKGERKKKGAKIGYTIKNLHLKKKRLGIGTVLVLNDNKNSRRLNYLYKKYKLVVNS